MRRILDRVSESTLVPYEMFIISYETENFSYETAHFSYENVIDSYEIVSGSYEMIAVSYENTRVSYEMQVVSYETVVGPHKIPWQLGYMIRGFEFGVFLVEKTWVGKRRTRPSKQDSLPLPFAVMIITLST